jgi:hypothetical protein
MAEREWPDCIKCGKGQLVPLSDYGPDGAAVTYKAWACTNAECGFLIRVQKGEVAYGRAVRHAVD